MTSCPIFFNLMCHLLTDHLAASKRQTGERVPSLFGRGPGHRWFGQLRRFPVSHAQGDQGPAKLACRPFRDVQAGRGELGGQLFPESGAVASPVLHAQSPGQIVGGRSKRES